MNRIRVLIAEDHATVRHGLKLLVDAQSDMQVVGEASDGRAAVDAAMVLKPAVAVLDISMPVMNGLAAARVIRERAPDTAIVALTRYGDAAYVKDLLEAGACAYVLKQSPSSELLQAIRAAAKGKQHLDRALAAEALSKRTRGDPPVSRITDRETEVLRLMALGHSNKDIAAALGISVKTVEVHKTNAMRKLGFQGRIDVVRYALLQGWLQDV